MKLTALITLVNSNRVTIPPGAEIDVTKKEADFLMERGFAAIPKGPSTPASREEKPPPGGDTPPGGDGGA
ncbi:MAG: hypothetical protein FWD77_01610 [Betaproteobacteria bacterium]|nr:hypothetical protein [Betaproteobacteria bacterium]